MDCLFCKIIAEQIPSEKILETAQLVAFKDVHPKAPVHILIVPKRHIELPEELNEVESLAFLQAAEEVAQIQGIKETGYRLIFNVGRDAGQEMPHLHLHVIGGQKASTLY